VLRSFSALASPARSRDTRDQLRTEGQKIEKLNGKGGRGRMNVAGKTRVKESRKGDIVRGVCPVEGSTGVDAYAICGARQKSSKGERGGQEVRGNSLSAGCSYPSDEM